MHGPESVYPGWPKEMPAPQRLHERLGNPMIMTPPPLRLRGGRKVRQKRQ